MAELEVLALLVGARRAEQSGAAMAELVSSPPLVAHGRRPGPGAATVELRVLAGARPARASSSPRSGAAMAEL